MAITTPTAYDTPTLLLTDEQLKLLANAEMIVNECYCTNHCIHHHPLVPCTSCAMFEAADDGHIACDGYAQLGEAVA